ncbi:LysR substrate-binding domain-containing protein [Streptomyces sp. NPDC001276]|uniref:LysR substrate-binding domain-containing protein n=1 Tax=Streptomyces sp. NPDC001276 TaxID=3364555 RepID=UPI0036747AB7
MHAPALWKAPWGLAVPACADVPDAAASLEVFARFRAQDWIVNSRNTADETVIRTLASMAGFTPRITHQVDSLDLVQGMITAGLGAGLLPIGTPTFSGVRLIPLTGPQVALRAYAVARHGRLAWPQLTLVTDLLARRSATTAPDSPAPPP